MIRIENLVKNYGDVLALKSISFDVNDGEIVGFLGANGAGKSTTLKIMTSYLSPTSGNVYVNDKNIRDHSLEIRKQIGYLPESNPLYGEMNVYDLLEFAARIRGITGKDFRKALNRVVDQCGLQGVIHRPVSACSKGYKQRIGLAMAMIHDPKILILDEPVTGLDPNQIIEIRELIKGIGQQKVVIMSSHILQEIEATVDRIVIIDDGKIVADGTSQELIANLKGRTQLTLEIKNVSDESLQQLRNKLADVTVEIGPRDGDALTLSLEYERGRDPREEIFKHAVASDWVLLEMSRHKVQLEDVFRSLTQEGGSHA
ncbi:MAG: ABC transporter ATP-binding protein [Fidelibacterota bacterium]